MEKAIDRYYVLTVVGDVEPQLSAAFENDEDRDQRARFIKAEDPEESGIYALDVQVDEYGRLTVEVNSYSNAFLETEEDLPQGLKTLAGWKAAKCDLQHYLNVGDRVDDALYEEMLNCVPPRTHRTRLMQVGEPVKDVNGKPVYATFYRCDDEQHWRYGGNCYPGSHVEPENV
jgi:hypothetical protein